jgi:dihydroflavonol-4-reductase
MGFEPAVIPYAVKYWFVDNSKAKKELGVTFRGAKEILEPTLKWVKEEGLLDPKKK